MNRRRCPNCAELVRREASVCRYCQAKLTPLQGASRTTIISVAIASAAAAALGAGLLSYSAFRPTSSAQSAKPQKYISEASAQPIVTAPQFPLWPLGETLRWTSQVYVDPVRRQAGPYIIEITADKEGETTAPIVRISVGSESVTMRGEMAAPDFPHSITLFANRTNAVPVVMLQSFTGGAHCCYHVQLAGYSSGQLKVVDFGSRDAEVQTPKDQSGDGIADFKVQDERFLYAFAPYAYSVAPPQFLNVVNGAVKDVSRDPHFRRSFADGMTSAGQSCEPGTGYTANGACPAFLAAAARVGKLDAAWSQMIAAYDPSVDWSLPTGCLVPNRTACPQGDEITYKSYPDALRAFLVDAGYIPRSWVPPEQRAVRPQPKRDDDTTA